MSIPNLPQQPPPSPHYSSPFTNNKKKYTEEDYEEIYYHFDDYSQDIILANATKFLVPPEPAEDYEWEEIILDEAGQDEWEGMKKSLLFGVGCGIVGFVGLRWRRIRGAGGGSSFGGVGLSKYASSSSMQKPTRSSGGYTFDPIPKPNPMQQQQQQQQMNLNMMQQNQQHFNNSNQGSGGGLLMDISLATLLGMGTTLLALQTDIFYPSTTAISISSDEEKTTISLLETKPPPPQWISETIPLVPGRSMISDTLCTPLTREFRKFPKELWQSGNKNRGIENGYNNHMALYANSGWKGTKYSEGNDNASLEILGEHGDSNIEGGSIEQQQQGMYEHLLLDSLQGFIINCERRARQENKIRKLRGLREHVPVAIPYGGVDADEDLELDDVYFEKSHEEDDNDCFGL